MATTRRQLRKRQTRRRRVSRRQVGGTVEEDYTIIRTIHRHISNPGEMIAAIYTTRGLYAKIPDSPPGSAIGEDVIPEHYARPHPKMKPLNSVIKGAFNFFQPYAGRARGSESERAEWEMAKQINNKLSLAFLIFIGTNTRTVMERGVAHSIPASTTKLKQANKLFGDIARSINGPGIGEMGADERAAKAREEGYAQAMKRYVLQQEMEAAQAEAARKQRYNEITRLMGGPMEHERIEHDYLLGERIAANKAAGGAGRAAPEPPVVLDPNFM